MELPDVHVIDWWNGNNGKAHPAIKLRMDLNIPEHIAGATVVSASYSVDLN